MLFRCQRSLFVRNADTESFSKLIFLNKISGMTFESPQKENVFILEMSDEHEITFTLENCLNRAGPFTDFFFRKFAVKPRTNLVLPGLARHGKIN